MRWRKDSGMEILWSVLALTVATAGVCDGARRPAQRRKDTSPAPVLYDPVPSTESLQVIAQAMGAAGFEHYTEGRPLVKRLIPAAADSPDIDIVEHQGVIGKAGVDFPAYPNIPNTGFNCKNVPTGYYADLETDCQVFHICDTSRKISFLCPNGTIFSQSHLICDWWFKVDCASAPALYESSAEYYSNEQKKTQKVTQSLSKNRDLQQIDGGLRAESRRSSVNIPSTTERLLRHRQRLQSQTDTPYTVQATSRSYQALFPDTNFNPTQRSQLTTAFEKRRKNLVQLISNNFAFPSRSTKPSFFEASTLKTTPIDYNFKEMQVAAESASFAANKNNRQFLQDYNAKNYRPYPVYTPNTPKPKPKSSPNLTTLYDIRDRDPHASNTQETTKRPTLIPYTKSYTTANDPYTRPGVSLLRNYLAKEKNRTFTSTTEKNTHVQEKVEERPIENKNAFESVTKIPTTRADISYFSETASSDRYNVYSTTNHVEGTTEPSYKERRDRLMRKLNLDSYGPTEPTVSETPTEKFYGDQSRSGLVVPASSSKTLHSLAIYYATALDNLSTTPNSEETEVTTPVFDYEAMEEALPALFSSNTINKYSNLFAPGADNAELLEEIKEDPNGTYNELMEDLMVQQSQSPLATSPQIRELAQVFTHALSAYLQDPVQFRKVLSDIRPTHPTFGELGSTTDEPVNTEPTTTINEDDDEILGFSEDNKTPLSNAREPKALDLTSKYQTNSYDDVKVTTLRPTEVPSSTFNYRGTSARNPFRCCGKISASYTSVSTPLLSSTTPIPFTNTVAFNVNTLASNYSEISTTENYSGTKFGGFQNNNNLANDPYGTGIGSTQNKPLSEYVEATNLPAAWGIDVSASTSIPVSTQDFESKKIRTTTVIPTTTAVYFTESDSVELENEEELQRAHSQSFVGPQSNNLRQGKQLNIEESSTVKRPSEDLEAPTLPDEDVTTIQTTPEPTTYKEESTTTTQVPSSVFTSPDFDKTTNQFLWSSTFDNWQSTVIDPITLNDGLSHTAPEDITTDIRDTSYTYNTATTPTIDYGTTEQAVSSTSNIELTTSGTKADNRRGRILKDVSTEPAQDISAITDTVVEKAKEIMGGMNATTTQKLMNVMKKTKSKTVKRLILLLVQTCDDDHNSTAEASKKALLEALMAVSQKDMEEIAREEEASTPENETFRRTDRVEVRPRLDRRGKSLTFDPSAINSLSNPTSTTERVQTSPTTERVTTTEEPETTVSSTTTTQSSVRTTANRRGVKKFGARTTPLESRSTKSTFIDTPKAEARTADKEDLKTASDTRALELLRSLYTIAARWG